MNKQKYEGIDHEVRHVVDLKDIVTYSCRNFADRVAYLQKDRPGGEFSPIFYRQVKEDMDALGTKLIDMGLKGQKIAVIGETSYRWFLSYFAAVCGTGVVVPLDKNLPPDEVKNLVQRSGAAALIFTKKSEPSVEALFDEPYDVRFFICMNQEKSTERVLSMDELIADGNRLLKQGMRDFVDAEIDPDQMASLIFTSGTTGRAKGVMLSHRNIAANCEHMSRRMHLEPHWVVLSILPTHHTFENTCVDWTTFYQGATLAICEGIKHILKNMNEVHANVLVGVPLVFEKIYKGMMKQADARGEGDKLRNAIRLSRRMKLYNNEALCRRLFKAIHQALGGQMHQFIAGGAAIDPEVIKAFEAMGIPMMQGYGLTECAPIIAVNQDNWEIPESVGRPMTGTQVRIVDAGEDGIGEIAARGPSVMLGYYEDPVATAEVLRDGWLYTGDLGYLDDRGYLYVTGRKKTVIVTKGGKNIFPEELEEVLKQNELVKECLVHGVNDRRIGNVIITADIQPNYELLRAEKGDMTDSEIYHFYKALVDGVNAALPSYKAIKRINIRKEDFAMTTTGKIKRYGNFIEGEEQEGSMDYREIIAEEKKAAQAIQDEINNSDDPYYLYKHRRPIIDIRDMFYQSCELYADRPAFMQKFVKGGEYETITYRQAEADVKGLGTALVNHGLKDERIAVIGDTRYQWESAYLAVVCGTGVVVPLDKLLSENELKDQLRRAEVKAVFFDGRFREMFRSIKASGETAVEVLIDLDAGQNTEDVLSRAALIKEGKELLAKGDRQFLDAEIIAEDMAILLFTSGTTGAAKGVMISNRNICVDLMVAPTVLNPTPEDVFFSLLPVHHTYECTCDFLMPLYLGSSIAFCEGLKYIVKNLQETHPTMLLAVPLLIETLYKRIWKEARKKGKEKQLRMILKVAHRTRKLGINVARPFVKDILDIFGGRMKCIISGGAAIDPQILQFFNDIGITAVQGYGLTECAPMGALNPDDPRLMRNSSVGRVMPTMKVKIIDKDDKGIGEICLKGGNVMMGYYKNPEETAKSLIDGWFHTGDLGYVDDDDFIYITGRKKNVIITKNGENVFPEELEYKLSLIPYITESFVWGAGSGSGTNDETIAATVRVDEEEVAEKLGEGYTEEQKEKLVRGEIDKLNETLPPMKKIRRVVFRKAEFIKNTSQKLIRFNEANKEA